MVTSDYVLDEVITSLFEKVNFDGALKFVEAIFLDIKKNRFIWKR